MTQSKQDIIIIGAGLTGLALAYYLKKAGKKVVILEKLDRYGGVIQTLSENGFTYETGPSTGVIGTIEIAELFEDLQGKCNIEIAEETAKKRLILKNGKWQALPTGLFTAITTPLFTWYDKFRILSEPFRKKGTNPDESVAELVKRRLGNSFLDYAVDPFISGVYAGNPEKIITRFALPKLFALEQNYGSFIRGSIKKAKATKLPGTEKISRKVFSVKGGLAKLTNALATEIGEENILLNSKNIQINSSNNEYQAQFSDYNGNTHVISSLNIVTTVVGNELAQLLPFISAEKLTPILSTNYADVVQMAVGFKKWPKKPLQGFGGLIPFKENREILGILFPSAIFKKRAPENGALLSVFIGGSRKPEMINKSDEELINVVNKEIMYTFGENLKPDFIQVFRHKHAIAQYDILSEKKLQAITEIENTYDGLYIAGSLRDGIGMADRVKQAKQIALLLSNK